MVVVEQFLGEATAPLVCTRIPVDLLVLVARMIPAPGELFADWSANTGYEESSTDDVFYHDVPLGLAARAQRRERVEASKRARESHGRSTGGPTPRRGISCAAEDRVFTAAASPGVTPVKQAQHRAGRDGRRPLRHLGRPGELADRLDAYAGIMPDTLGRVTSVRIHPWPRAGHRSKRELQSPLRLVLVPPSHFDAASFYAG